MSGDNKDVDKVTASMASVQLKEMSPLPDFIDKRIQLWEKYKERYLKELSEKPNHSIKVTVRDKNGEEKQTEGLSWKTSPAEVAKQVGPKSWTDSLVIARVNGVLWDLDRPLEEDSDIHLLTFNDDDGML